MADPYHDPYDDDAYFDEELASIFMPDPPPSLNDLSLGNNTNADETNNNNDNAYLFPVPEPINHISRTNHSLADPLLSSWGFTEDQIRINAGEICPSNPEINLQGRNYLEGFMQEGASNVERRNYTEDFNQEGTSNSNIQGNHWQTENAFVHGGNNGEGSSRPVSTWQQEQNVPISCDNSCQVLRQISHSNGQDIMRLEIHGTIGFISHAVYLIQPNPGPSGFFHRRTVDFSNKSIGEVENFLRQYCNERVQEGFFMMDDPLASFYRVLCFGFGNPNANRQNNEAVEPQPPPFPVPVAEEPVAMETETERPRTTSVPGRTEQSAVTDTRRKKQTPLAEQRIRTKKMILDDISSQFKVPIQEAARNLSLSATVLKKVCRRGGLERWPYRKLKSLEKKKEALIERMRSENADERAYAESEFVKLQAEIERICSGQENDIPGTS